MDSGNLDIPRVLPNSHKDVRPSAKEINKGLKRAAGDPPKISWLSICSIPFFPAVIGVPVT